MAATALLLAAGLITNQVWSKGEQHVSGPTGPSADLMAGLDETACCSEEVARTEPPTPAGKDAPPITEVAEEILTLPAELVSAPRLVRNAPEPILAPLVFLKRREDRTEEDLRKQLAWTPEIGLSLADVSALGEIIQRGIKLNGRVNLEPWPLLQVRPDLATLSIRSGRNAQLDQPSAANFHVLSRKLRFYLDAATLRDAEGKRPDPVWLRLNLWREKRGNGPEWVRPEAVPVLMQLLAHEDRPLRLMLLELLAEIPHKVATVALAQRAVFDLAPEIRAEAVRQLRDRPPEQYRPYLQQALRHPWAPAADHAAEALILLGDRASVPYLVSLLKEPDPRAPQKGASNQYYVREMVQIRHEANCLMCHPPAQRASDPVTKAVPGVNLIRQSGGGGCGTRPPTLRSSPLFIRADITFIRQDFSAELPVRLPNTSLTTEVRFDYVLRVRMANAQELKRLKNPSEEKSTYEQREAVLFALRELTGLDAGPTTEAWQQRFPRADLDTEAARLSDQLVYAATARQAQLLTNLKEGKGEAYTQALVGAIPHLKEPAQDKAREALAERLARLTVERLRELFEDDNAEVRRATAQACAKKKDKALAPDLIDRLYDPEPAVVQAAHAALKSLSGQDFGPAQDATPEQLARAAESWRAWWEKEEL
jgi:HEAT repeat protein